MVELWFGSVVVIWLSCCVLIFFVPVVGFGFGVLRFDFAWFDSMRFETGQWGFVEFVSALNIKFRSLCFRLVGRGSVRFGSARLGSARLGSARLGSARLGSARLDSIRFDSIQFNSLLLLFVLSGLCLLSRGVPDSGDPMACDRASGAWLSPSSRCGRT